MQDSYSATYIVRGADGVRELQGGQKTDTLCFVRLNFIKYWPISNLFHCQNQENILIIMSLKIPSHLKCVATLPCEMSGS